MLTWWGIMLDVVDTPYRADTPYYAYVDTPYYAIQSGYAILCLRGGALCSASVWRIHHIKHNTLPR